MDKHLNDIEKKMQELMTTYDYHQLNGADQKLVDQNIGQHEYQLQRQILIYSSDLYEETEFQAVAPPQLRSSGNGIFWFKSRPLYQTIAAVAATVLIMLWIQNPGGELVITKHHTEYITQYDTVELVKNHTDTVYLEVEKTVYVEKTQYVSSPPVYASADCPEIPEERPLQPGLQIVLPDSKFNHSNKRVQDVIDDPTTSLVSNLLLKD